ncbi:hypothetical protein AM588_10011150 [Phytophthora nicotianae]|uniref:NOT2/NOT3/NOT5 C-terminal domain-containing protein n=1 Tax=Phytophthora nicotianae TaxID=4792 RepID=A0A0W8DRS0_PHYNI|nr:hypothetical protein AM588_10011150 [Phytophthora nicotianae]
MIDPSKDKFAYFKDNIQTAEDKFLSGSGVGRMQVGGSAIPPTHELHRINSGRSFPMPTENKAPDMSEFPALGSSVNLGTEAFDHFRAPRQDEQTEASNGELDPSNQYGLLGMLHTIIRPGNGDATKNLAMGCDLTSLGLNLNSAEPLYPTFASPWSEEQLTKEPQFSLPMCYYNQPPVLKTTHLSKFHLETLFFIFYSMPKDVLQAYAAQELYSREWRYHAELKTWLKRASPADAALLAGNASSSVGASSNGSPTGATGNGSIGSIGSSASTGPSLANSSMTPQFLYFDTATWERRVFTGNINSISGGLLGEEEIRVKFNASS